MERDSQSKVEEVDVYPRTVWNNKDQVFELNQKVVELSDDVNQQEVNQSNKNEHGK